jgi:PAS domain S-box-containing protein
LDFEKNNLLFAIFLIGITNANTQFNMSVSKNNYLPLNKNFFVRFLDSLSNQVGSLVRPKTRNKNSTDNRAHDYRVRQLLMENESLRKKADKYVKQANQLSSIIENTSEGIFQTTPTGKYIFANKPLARIYGYDDTHELIFHLNDIAKQLYLDPHKRMEFQDILSKNDRVIEFESEVKRSDGKTIWIKENARAVHDETGEILYYEGTVEDITSRKLAELELQKLAR